MENFSIPSSAEAEKMVLSAAVQNPDFLAEVGLLAEDFSERNRIIYRAAESLALGGTPVGIETISTHLTGSGDLARVGGAGYVSELIDALPTPDRPRFDYYIAEVEKIHGERKVFQLAHSILSKISNRQEWQDTARDLSEAIRNGTANWVGKTDWISAWKPSQFKSFVVPPDFVLVGPNHIQRGSFAVLGGWPGTGKSRLAVALAIAGATGKPWMGLPVHSKFKTLIIQTENGENRLKEELSAIGDPSGVDLDEWLRVTPPPPFGLAFDTPEFCSQVRAMIEAFKPGLIVIDPWNAVAADDRIRDYRQALDALRGCLPTDPNERPAVLVIHHMRKKGGNHIRKHGRDLLHELAGSYAIGATARTVYALEPATADTSDDQVVFTCCKCNDGEMGDASAWHRRDGLFEPCPDFDWEDFHNGGEKPRGITGDQIRQAVGTVGKTRSAIVDALMGITGKTKSPCYSALKRYEDSITEDANGLFHWDDLE